LLDAAADHQKADRKSQKRQNDIAEEKKAYSHYQSSDSLSDDKRPGISGQQIARQQYFRFPSHDLSPYR
jgi:hypothetical protein